MENPLLAASKNRYGAPAFDKIKTSDYLPAFKIALKEGKEDVDKIINNPQLPTFENTIEALEYAGEKLDIVSGIFFNMNEAVASDEMQKIAEDISPELTQFSLYILLNNKLFQRIKTVWQQRGRLNLDKEQSRLLEKRYKAFLENGAALSPAAKKEYSNALQKLNILELKFGKNVLDATNAFTLHITDKAELEGLPESAIAAGKAEAEERKTDGWVYTLQYPSFAPFMKYSSRRELRERMYMASSTRCTSGKFDNTKAIKEIVSLRIHVANLLGYNTFAAYALRNRMAKNTKTVNSFLNDLLKRSMPYAKRDVKRIKEFAAKNGFKEKFMPWDFSYWAEKYREKKYAFNDDLLKPYFKLENVQKAVFMLAGKLYGLNFTEAKDIPGYHKDVKVYDVTDSKGRHLALFYSDFYPRASKKGGAWMTNFREQGFSKEGEERRPFVSIVCNFTKPTATDPSLLTFYEVTTILHEFGHALNGILAEGRYPSLTGTNVARDFVELPSQIMENWATQQKYLSLWAKHYKTGKTIPAELIKKIIKAKNFNSGYASVRQLTFGICDMAWHTLRSVPEEDAITFEQKATKKCRVSGDKPIEGAAFCPAFTHIFSGGYSAGYYSYKWAEVLEADAFELFKQKGIFNRTVAESFRKNILSKGNIEDADLLYRRFRGRDPKPQALMKDLGMGKKLAK